MESTSCDGIAVCVLAVANQKGGVGKSTTAVNLAACLGALGNRTLLIDLDPQGNATSGFGLNVGKRDRCIYDALLGGVPVVEVIEATESEQVFVVPATIELAGAEIELVSALSRENRLKNILAPINTEFDFIIVDCPPSLGLLTINALTAANGLMIPIQCEYYALEGLAKLMDSVRLVRAHLNSSLEVFGVVMTMYDSRTRLSQQVVDEVREYFDGKAFDTLIPRTVRLSEAPSFGQPITVFDPLGKGANAYRSLAKEVVERVEQERLRTGIGSHNSKHSPG